MVFLYVPIREEAFETVNDYFATSLVSDLGLPNESMIGTVLRDGKVIVPRGEDDVRAGDHLLVCCTASAVTDVRDLFS